MLGTLGTLETLCFLPDHLFLSAISQRLRLSAASAFSPERLLLDTSPGASPIAWPFISASGRRLIAPRSTSCSLSACLPHPPNHESHAGSLTYRYQSLDRAPRPFILHLQTGLLGYGVHKACCHCCFTSLEAVQKGKHCCVSATRARPKQKNNKLCTLKEQEVHTKCVTSSRSQP